MSDLHDIHIDDELSPNGHGEPEPAAALPVEDGWMRDKAGKAYVHKPDGARGVLYRQGETETVREALERYGRPKDRKPKIKRPRMPPASKKMSLKELEKQLADALQTPAIFCAAAGDEWAVNHFTVRGEYLARNLINAAESNPWLAKKLEEFATGGDAAMKVIALVPVTGALVLYLVPPLAYWFPSLPIPEKGKQILQVPDRNHVPATPPIAPDDAPTTTA